MKTTALAFPAAAIAAAASLALLAGTVAPSEPKTRLLATSEVTRYIEAAFHGKVTGIEFDASAGKPAHYHTEVRFPRGSLARTVMVDVDAATKRMSPHEDMHLSTVALPAGTGSRAGHQPIAQR